MARRTPKKLSRGQMIGLLVAVILIFAAYGAAKNQNDNPSYTSDTAASSYSSEDSGDASNKASGKASGDAKKKDSSKTTSESAADATSQAQDAAAATTPDTAAPTSGAAASGAAASDSPYAVARAALAALPDAATVPAAPNYDRDEYGSGWLYNLGGCSTREVVLRRDLQNVTMRQDRKCKVHTGTLSPDPYGGGVINFDSTVDPNAVQIDHIVPLKQAWQLGAASWTPTQRVHFSNDTDNLIAVSGSQNGKKSDKSPAVWLVPANPSFRCEYARRYASVSAKYGLAIASADRQALDATLAACG